jgi:hypothetical protein
MNKFKSRSWKLKGYNQVAGVIKLDMEGRLMEDEYTTLQLIDSKNSHVGIILIMIYTKLKMYV